MEMSSSGAAGAVPKLEHPPAREARRCRVLLVAGLVALPLLAFFVLGQESASTVWEMASATFTVVLEPVRDLAWRYYKHFPYAPSPAGLGMAVIIWICTAPEPIHLLYIPSVLPLCSSSLPRQIHHPPPLLNERKIHLAHDLLGAPETHLIRSRVESITGAPSSRSSSSSARPCTETGMLPVSQVFWAFMA